MQGVTPKSASEDPTRYISAMHYMRARSNPSEHLRPGELWPNGQLEADAPIEAHLAQALSQRLNHARLGRSLKQIADNAGVSQDSLSRLLRGKTWGSMPVIARLEHALDTDLWGNEHRQQTTPTPPH